MRWLQNEVNPRLENLPEWPVGVTKYTYFESEAVWGIRILATIDNMDLVELANAHRKGDREAIFTFAKSNNGEPYWPSGYIASFSGV